MVLFSYVQKRKFCSDSFYRWAHRSFDEMEKAYSLLDRGMEQFRGKTE